MLSLQITVTKLLMNEVIMFANTREYRLKIVINVLQQNEREVMTTCSFVFSIETFKSSRKIGKWDIYSQTNLTKPSKLNRRQQYSKYKSSMGLMRRGVVDLYQPRATSATPITKLSFCLAPHKCENTVLDVGVDPEYDYM